MESPSWTSFKAALCFLPVGAIFGFVALSFSAPEGRGDGWGDLPACAGISLFLTAFLVWRLAVAPRGGPNALRGGIAGLVIGFLGHPALWYLMICVNWAAVRYSWRPGPASGEAPLGPLDGLLGALAFSLWSGALLGWLTVSVCGVLGALVGGWQGRTGGH